MIITPELRLALRHVRLEIFHRPTDHRLDYCRCGQSWPCELRRRFNVRFFVREQL